MRPYADTNFFTRIYLSLPESEEADRLFNAARKGAASLLPITWLHRMELANAFELSVWLGKQGGHSHVSSHHAAIALATFKEDLREEAFVRPVLVDPLDLLPHFEEAVSRYTSKNGFRTYDILHVVSAKFLGCDQFFSFDERAKKLAALEGLKVIK